MNSNFAMTTVETITATIADNVNCTSDGTITCMPTQRTPGGGSSPTDIFYIVTTIVVGLGMIGIGATVHYKILLHYIKNPKAFILGVVLQLLIMPPLSWALTKIFDMSLGEALGVFIQGSSPGGNTSNLVVYWMGGIVDLSVAMTITTTLLSMGTISLWLLIYEAAEFPGRDFPIPLDRIAIALAALVVPVLIGMVIRVKLAKYAQRISRVLIIFGSVSVLALLIARGVLSPVPWIPSWKQIVVAAIMPPIAFVLGYLVTLIPCLDLKPASRKTVAVETSLQNAQIAGAVIELINSILRNPILLVQMLLFPILYYIFQVGYSIIYIIGYRIAIRKGWIKESNEDETGIDVRTPAEIELDKVKNKNNEILTVFQSDGIKGKENPTFEEA